MKVLLAVFLLFSHLMPHPEGNLEEAIRLYEKGEFNKAASRLIELSRSSPDDPKARFWLGKAYLKIRKWEKAVQELEKATEIEPSNAHYRLWLGRACGYDADHASILSFPIGKGRRVIKEFEAASKLAPKDIDIRFDMLEFYLQAPSWMGGGDDRAKAEVETIAKLDPQKGPIARAMMYKDKKKIDLAKKELIQATIDYPKYAAGYFDLVDFLLDQKDFEGAFKYSQKALELENSKRARFLSAAAQIGMGADLDKAEQSLQELASGTLSDNDPSFEEINYWIGECHLAKGNKAKAREAFKTALVFNPDYGPAKKAISKLR